MAYKNTSRQRKYSDDAVMGKKYKRNGIAKPNPIQSASQYGLMQAVASGVAKIRGITKSVARKLIKETPSGTRSKWASELAANRQANPIPVGLVEGVNWAAGNKLFEKVAGKRKNPDIDTSEAARMSESFHGRAAQEEFEVEEVSHYDPAMAVLGDLVEFVCVDGRKETTINFSKNRPKLCCDSQGHYLEIIGGDQELEFNEDRVTYQEYQGKQLVPLGYAESVAYETDKYHLEDSDGEVAVYEHQFGEEGGEQPMLVYNATDKKILVVGGSYTIEDVGIKN